MFEILFIFLIIFTFFTQKIKMFNLSFIFSFFS